MNRQYRSFLASSVASMMSLLQDSVRTVKAEPKEAEPFTCIRCGCKYRHRGHYCSEECATSSISNGCAPLNGRKGKGTRKQRKEQNCR